MTRKTSLKAYLESVRLLPRRLVLHTPGVEATVPMLRGTWGAALHALDQRAYEAVFSPGEGLGVPGYLMRPAAPRPRETPALEMILFGQAIDWDTVLLRAWDRACRSGLGPNRHPFFLRGYVLGPDGEENNPETVWTLADALWPLDGEPERTPCRLTFLSPVRLMRAGRMLSDLTLSDLVVGLVRRIEMWLPADMAESWKVTGRQLLALAREIPAGQWRGERLDFVRYSGRQKSEIEMHGVIGGLELPAGPGPLWLLLAAGQWTHLGKGTVMGLGQLRIERAE